MSIDLNVYAKREILTREVLARECNSADLPEEMRWEVVFLPSEHESPKPDPKAKLTEDQQVAGWPVTSKQAGEIRSAFLRNDRQTLETHARGNNMSLDLQQFLWRMIGALTYGLLEDPQEGEYEDCAEDESTA